MAIADFQPFLGLLPVVKHAPGQNIWLYYDEEADTLYVNFKKPSVATDSELTDDDVIVRYDGEEVIGYTVLHASQRRPDPIYEPSEREPTTSGETAAIVGGVSER